MSNLSPAIFDALLDSLDALHRALAKEVPSPQITKVNVRVGEAHRYVEQTHQRALVLKLARLLSALQGIRTLWHAGLFQEQAVLQRVADELNEDIMFICSAIRGPNTELHDRFFSAFWSEEFPDSPDTLARHQKPDLPRRSKIRAYIHRVGLPEGGNTSLANDVGHSLSSTYSGFVHGSAPQIMDMYFGDPPSFHTRSQDASGRSQSQLEDAANVFYRSALSFEGACIVFGRADLSSIVGAQTDIFGAVTGVADLPPHLAAKI
jgi:hypothetical protein